MKNKIQSLKKDKLVLKNYIKCLCDGKKANEQLSNNINFQNLKNNIKEKKQYD